jgi:hypothetical protein
MVAQHARLVGAITNQHRNTDTASNQVMKDVSALLSSSFAAGSGVTLEIQVIDVSELLVQLLSKPIEGNAPQEAVVRDETHDPVSTLEAIRRPSVEFYISV